MLGKGGNSHGKVVVSRFDIMDCWTEVIDDAFSPETIDIGWLPDVLIKAPQVSFS